MNPQGEDLYCPDQRELSDAAGNYFTFILDAMQNIVVALLRGAPLAMFPDNTRGRATVAELLVRHLAAVEVTDLVVRELTPSTMSLERPRIEALSELPAGLVVHRRIVVADKGLVPARPGTTPLTVGALTTETPLPWALYLIGDSFVVIRARGEGTLRVLLNPGELANTVIQLHEALWLLLGQHTEAGTTAEPPPRHLRLVLNSLAEGLTDQAAQRVLTLSSRTFSRRASELMTALGARSRFQAGVAAAHRRWV